MANKEIFNFNLRPGKERINDFVNKKIEIKVSIITPYYNSKDFFDETFNSVINQSFPYFEWIIVDDGSTEEDTIEYLDNLAKKDRRIRVYHKKNEGPALARDFGIEKAISDYIYMVDSDDLLDPTIVETLYFSMITNPDYSMAYTNLASFSDIDEKFNYLDNKEFSFKNQLKKNFIYGNIMLKKDKVKASGGYSLAERGVHEDWHLWQRMIRDGNNILHLDFYGFWYRRQEGILNSIISDKKKNKYANYVINSISKEIKKSIKYINFPSGNNYYFNEQPVPYNGNLTIIDKYKKTKTILLVLPWLTTGGADRFYIDVIKRLKKENYNVVVVTTEICNYQLRQEVTYDCDYYDLTTFLNPQDWAYFIDYIIKVKCVDMIFFSNSYYGYYVLPWLRYQHPEVVMVDYIHAAAREWRNGGYGRDSSAVSYFLDNTFTCTNFLKNELINDYKSLCNIDCAYIGVDTDKFDGKNITYDKTLFETYKGRPTLLFLCRLAPEKRPIFALNVIKELKKEIPDILLYVVGDGLMMDKMVKYVDDNNLKYNVHFWGEVSYEETKKFYVESDILLITSFIEGLTLTAYEAESIGTPVISSDVGGQKELINDSNGKIIPLMQDPNKDYENYNYSEEELKKYCDATIHILNNIESYKKNCRSSVVNHFDSKELMEDFIKKLKKLMSKKSNVKNIDPNVNFYEAYLVQYLEYRKFTGPNVKPKNKQGLKQKLSNLWRFRTYRFMVRVYRRLFRR